MDEFPAAQPTATGAVMSTPIPPSYEIALRYGTAPETEGAKR